MTVRVFLVEDSLQVRDQLASHLASAGRFRVVGHATNETEANQWLREHVGEWDVAVVDLVLEHGSGMAVLSKASRLPGAGKIAVYSAYATSAVEEHCRALGADAVFEKADPKGLLAWLSGLGAAPL
ncbi:MAG TPA: response regulator [Ramlibacter sp.]|nr:response regulator [Ramlibacter sp.]